ncbi:MAG TPA: MoxR family ATPase [Candidatus Hydrogenedentes bacterium]|nr:MoxR family ATPase [Candidatus Hydrogenedentota bacterium]HOV75989.1 MoxR family ATPase [Candidatus Hydrogenedentota bacterium]HPC18130.1 MoxR family ATPase [Candidatus Hydrogenedentota bacterium]HRT21716.1 MoxR family ATPase [Candidatus Hydrogenedentota bacterium]HRT66782.1 MoxR family ATPase [Candidatus Hydrogenedentota bacterium]
MREATGAVHRILSETRREIAKVIIGQGEVVDRALIAIFAGRHALIEGVPGVAKTLLVRTLAQLLGCPFQRIQFTPDLSPADIVGTNAFNPRTSEFTLIHGPIFTTFLLADEINRAPAKTQSALLQAMQERQVTIDRQTYALSPNFTVFATQNPIESEGTYPLPEAQKDRFLIKIHMGYPNEDDERMLAERTLTKNAPEALLERGEVQPVLTSDRLAELRESLGAIEVCPEIVRYAVALVRLTRNHAAISVGAGPRATQALLLSSRVHAALHGRGHVVPSDIRAMAMACLEHRLILKPDFVAKGLTCAEAVNHVLQSVPAPTVKSEE